MAGWLAGSQGSWTNPAGAGSINPTQAAAAAAGSERANEEAGAVVGDGLPACGGRAGRDAWGLISCLVDSLISNR